jgi:predicted nucleotidyltransferase
MASLTARALSPDEVSALVQKKKDWILGACSPACIILFGSAAAGEMTEASDIDLILIFSNLEEMKKSQALLWKSLPADDWPADIIFHTVSSFRDSCNKGGDASWIASREGRIIYGREQL